MGVPPAAAKTRNATSRGRSSRRRISTTGRAPLSKGSTWMKTERVLWPSSQRPGPGPAPGRARADMLLASVRRPHRLAGHAAVKLALLELGEAAHRPDDRLDGDEVHRGETGLAEVRSVDANQAARAGVRPEPDRDPPLTPQVGSASAPAAGRRNGPSSTGGTRLRARLPRPSERRAAIDQSRQRRRRSSRAGRDRNASSPPSIRRLTLLVIMPHPAAEVTGLVRLRKRESLEADGRISDNCLIRSPNVLVGGRTSCLRTLCRFARGTEPRRSCR